MRYSDKELKVIIAKIQLNQLILIEKDKLNQLFNNITDLLQSLQDLNFGISKNLATTIQADINNLLPTIESDINNVPSDPQKLIDTPLGTLDLENSVLGNMLKFKEFQDLRSPRKGKSTKRSKQTSEIQLK